MNQLASMTIVRLVFEFVPVFLSIVTAIYCFASAREGMRLSDNLFFSIATINAVILMLAQTSWMWSISVGEQFATTFADLLWTVFNTSVMLSYLLPAYFLLKARDANKQK